MAVRAGSQADVDAAQANLAAAQATWETAGRSNDAAEWDRQMACGAEQAARTAERCGVVEPFAPGDPGPIGVSVTTPSGLTGDLMFLNASEIAQNIQKTGSTFTIWQNGCHDNNREIAAVVGGATITATAPP